MSVRTMARVWAESQLAGTDLLMLLAIADFADDEGNAYPAVGTLASKCRMSARNANYILTALQASGELRVLKNEGPKGTNRYRIMLAQLGHEPLKPIAALKRASPLKPAAPPSPEAGCTPEAVFTLKLASPTPEAHFPKPLKPTSDEPSLNHQEPPTLARNVVARQDPDGFAEFWAAWPASSRKQDRKKCAEKWKRNKLARALSQILAHVTAMKGTKTWREGFEPAPLTYLTGERWNDGMPPVERALSPLHADDVFEAAR